MLRRILTFLGYLGLTLLVVAVTFALVAYGKDYAYDFSTRSIIQKGHVILGSTPNGLKVTADGKALKKKTPYQAAYKVGDHTFKVERDGFWPWEKVLQVVAGQVTLARYIIMVPKEPQTTVLDSRTQIVAQSVSKDHRHLAYITGGADVAVYTIDVGANGKPVKLYAPKAATETVPAEVLGNVEWSDDASHLLITSTVGDQPVHRLATAGGGEPVNLTDRYKFNFTGLKFSASNWRQLYWISPEGLRRVDAENQVVSAVLADKVTQFWVEPDRVLYVQQTDLGRSLWSLDSRGHHQELIQALVESDSYSVAYANYRGEDELAVVPAKTQVGTLYSGIYGTTPVAKTVARGATSARFSPDGHFLAFSSPTTIVTYDLERSSIEGASVTYSIENQPGQLTALTWFDTFHLLLTRDGHLYWSEYDGGNLVDLGPEGAGLPGYGTADGRSVVTFRPVGQTVRLMELLVKP
jgi:hypothetical protein